MIPRKRKVKVKSTVDKTEKNAATQNLPRHQGVVRWFSSEKGYGFIELPLDKGGQKVPDIFVHYRGIRGTGYLNLSDNQVVDFEIVKGEKGPQANDVVVVSDPKAANALAYANDEVEEVA
jgi:CspA family cold shock protein